jgi:hypothetical protein
MTNTPIFPQTIVNSVVSITNATGNGIGNAVTIRAGSTNGDKIESIAITSTDTSARVLTLIITISATNYIIGTVNIPIEAGTDGASTAAVSLLEINSMLPWIRRDQNNRGYLYIANGTTLKAFAQTTVTAAKQIDIFAQIGAY